MFDQKLLLNTFLYNLQSNQQLNGDLNTYNLYNLYGQLASLLVNNHTSQDLNSNINSNNLNNNNNRALDLGNNKSTTSLLKNNVNDEVKNIKTEPLNLTQASKSSLVSSNGQSNKQNSTLSRNKTSSSSSLRRQRERTTFDPQEEIPRLMQIFDQTHHPTRFQIATICDTLNSLECRKGKKPLEPYNIQYWFKNSRAALRRKLKIDQNNQEENGDGEEEDDDDDDDNEGEDEENDAYESSCESIKKEDDYLASLPNKNAIYVINPQEDKCSNENKNKAKATKTASVEDDDDDDDEDDDHLSINESENCSNLNLNTSSLNNANNKSAQQSINRRNRIFIDPISEVPILEQYFQRETYPDHYLIEKICDDLNKGEYRLKFPKLEARNIQLWFKNHRAKLKRLKVLNGNHDKQSTDDSPASN
jgi:hypothetical protein